MIAGGILPAGPMYAQFRSIAEGVCRADRSGSRCIPPLERPLQVRNSPPTHQIRDAMAAAGFPTHSMQVMHWKHAAPRRPSTQPAAGAKSPCGRLVASERMLDDGFGTGRAEFVAHTSCQRCVSHSLLETVRWVPSNANVRALQAAQPRARNSAADEPASRHVFGQRIHTSIQKNSSLAPRRRTRLLPISIHGRPLAAGGWGGREAGAEASLGRKRAWGGSEPGA